MIHILISTQCLHLSLPRRVDNSGAGNANASVLHSRRADWPLAIIRPAALDVHW